MQHNQLSEIPSGNSAKLSMCKQFGMGALYRTGLLVHAIVTWSVWGGYSHGRHSEFEKVEKAESCVQQVTQMHCGKLHHHQPTNQPTNPPTNPTQPNPTTALRRAHQLPSRLPTASKVGKFTWRTRKGEVPQGLAGGWQPIGVYTQQLKTYLVGRTDIPEIFKTKYDHEIVWPIIMWLGSFACFREVYIWLNITYFFETMFIEFIGHSTHLFLSCHLIRTTSNLQEGSKTMAIR